MNITLRGFSAWVRMSLLGQTLTEVTTAAQEAQGFCLRKRAQD